MYIIPFKTVNTTKINKKIATALERYELAVGDELKFGPEGPFRLLEQTGLVKPALSQPPPVLASGGSLFPASMAGGQAPPAISAQERRNKRAADEKISLTSTDAKFLADQRVRERLGEEGALKRHAEILKETDNSRRKVEELNRRRIEMEEVLRAKQQRAEAIESELKELEAQKKRLDAEVYQTRESVSKTNSFQKALESFATEVNRKIGQMQSVASEKSQVLKDLSKKEFVRLYEKESVGQGSCRKLSKTQETSLSHLPKKLRTNAPS